jgi:hypothetical protein
MSVDTLYDGAKAVGVPEPHLFITLPSRLINQDVHVIRIALDKLPLLAVLDPHLDLGHFGLEGLAHLLHLGYHLAVDCPLSLLHYLHQDGVDEDASLG